MFSTTKSVFRKLPAFKTNFSRLKFLSRRVSSQPYVDKYKPVSHDRHLLTVQLVRTILRHQIPSSPRFVNGIGHIVWGVSVVLKNITCMGLAVTAALTFTIVMMHVQGFLINALVPPASQEAIDKWHEKNEREEARCKADPEYAATQQAKRDFTDMMVTAANIPWK